MKAVIRLLHRGFTVRYAIVFTAVFLALGLFAAEARAESKIVQCGAPVESHVPTDPGIAMCDIYTRQLAYREKRLALKAQLEERQRNFAAPSKLAHERYIQNLERLHENAENPDYRLLDNLVQDDTSADDPFVP